METLIGRPVLRPKKKEDSKRPDFVLLAVLALLLIIGLEAVYSSSFAFSLAQYGDATYIVSRQAFWAVGGTVLLLVCTWIDYKKWQEWSPKIVIISLISLVLVFVPIIGMTQNGAQRWLRLPPPLPAIQPSEFVKLTMIIYFSAWLTAKGDKVKEFKQGIVPFFLSVGVVSGLILIQPDMGTAIVIAVTGFIMFFLAGANVKYLSALVAIAAGSAVPFILMVGYRIDRIKAFVDPWSAPLDQGYHIIQSLIALGSGGLTGIGLGSSRQKFLYVPGSHTDAVFAIIGEELGFVGAVSVIVLFSFLAYRGFKIALSVPDRFGSLLSMGITCWFCLQVLINIGGITKSIPFTGIPLPFVSYGGSSLAISMAAVGILLNISKHVPAGAGRRKLSNYLSDGT